MSRVCSDNAVATCESSSSTVRPLQSKCWSPSRSSSMVVVSPPPSGLATIRTAASEGAFTRSSMVFRYSLAAGVTCNMATPLGVANRVRAPRTQRVPSHLRGSIRDGLRGNRHACQCPGALDGIRLALECRAVTDDPLQLGRAHYQRRAWSDAWQSLSQADQAAPLQGDDLERLAMAAYLLGRDGDYLLALERAHAAHLAAGDRARAVRCAFWLGLRLMFRGETGHATGWLGRAQRLLDQAPHDCVEQGYLLLPLVNQHLDAGEFDAAYSAAERAGAIGDRFADAELTASARHLQGRARIEQGRVTEGLALLDEAMLAVATGTLSPMVTGLTYCSVIDGCQQAHAMRRAHEWTAALTQWCDAQPEMVAFSGICLVHRAEILQTHGAWDDALAEARRAQARCEAAGNRHAAGAALYQQAEVLRLRGEFDDAEDAYGQASRHGWDPQPGLALLRAAQRRVHEAARAIDVALRTATQRCQRARLLPAAVQVLLQAGERDAAARACDELEAIATGFCSEEFGALAAYARGSLALAAGHAHDALPCLQRAAQVWQHEAPYGLARARMQSAHARHALGDADGARLDFDAARALFARLGAAPDLAQADASVLAGAGPGRPHGLTARELQVLRLVAAGKSNKAIATALFLSERTIDRHVSNILAKLDVPSRAAATAFAYEADLIRRT
ncbi:MAG: hypothetical protein KIT60_14280 [Burkholderiaceae bacterium]|nr:hypothetical protein [Burkholderiaceae bacterium]